MIQMGKKMALGLFVALLAVAVTGPVTAAEQEAAQEEKKQVKPVSAYGEIVGTMRGMGKGLGPIRLELFRVEDEQLVSVAATETAADGTFQFLTLNPGAYVVMPDLDSLPAGFGLKERLAFIRVGTEPVAAQLGISEIKKLEIRTPSLQVRTGEPFVVETAAFDAEGEYLFANAGLTLPRDTRALERSGNGARIQVEGRGRSVAVSARNGQVSATITLKVEE